MVAQRRGEASWPRVQGCKCNAEWFPLGERGEGEAWLQPQPKGRLCTHLHVGVAAPCLNMAPVLHRVLY